MKNILLIAASALLLFSCKKNDCGKDDVNTLKADRFVFGLSGGFAGLYDYYEVRSGNIYEDSTHDTFGNLVFKTVAMPQAKYNLALPLQSSFPSYLTAHPNATFNCAGCADQQTFYIETVTEGVKTTWSIDDIPSSMPTQVKPYLAQMRDVIAQLQ